MAITVAEKVLIVGRVLNLAYGVLLGYPITVIRAKGAPATPKYLMATHVSALLHAHGHYWENCSSVKSANWPARANVRSLMCLASNSPACQNWKNNRTCRSRLCAGS